MANGGVGKVSRRCIGKAKRDAPAQRTIRLFFGGLAGSTSEQFVKSGMSKHLLNYHDAVIYPSDLALLDSHTARLNDACINFQMTRLQHRKVGEKRARKTDGTIIDQLEDLFLDP